MSSSILNASLPLTRIPLWSIIIIAHRYSLEGERLGFEAKVIYNNNHHL